MTDGPNEGPDEETIKRMTAMALLMTNDVSQPIPDQKPSKIQYDLAPGHFAMTVADKGVLMENDLCVLEVLDPTLFSQIYPDWEERYQIKGLVLGQYRSNYDVEGSVGWFSRNRLMPMTEEQYNQTLGWIDGRHYPSPEEGTWIRGLLNSFMDGLAESTETMAKPMTCGMCGGRSVSIHVEQTVSYGMAAGELKNPNTGEPTIMAISDYHASGTTDIHLHCRDCGATNSDPTEDGYAFNIPGIKADKTWEGKIERPGEAKDGAQLNLHMD